MANSFTVTHRPFCYTRSPKRALNGPPPRGLTLRALPALVAIEEGVCQTFLAVKSEETRISEKV